MSELLESRGEQEKGQDSIISLLQDWILEPYLPGVRRLNAVGKENPDSSIWMRGLFAEYPVMLYGLTMDGEEESVTESDYARLLMLEGTDEDRKSIEEEALEYDEDAMHLDQSLEDALLAENGMYLENQAAQQNGGEEVQEELGSTDFIPAQEKQYHYQWDELQEYEAVIKAFYAVDSTTKADAELLETEALLSKDMRIEGGADAPQILIYHTHAQEAFADSVQGDLSTGIVGAGDYLAALLREQYGYNVMHHTVSYDAEARDYAYSNSLPAIEKLLEDNPSIEVVIDLHRDEMPADRRLVVDIQGRPTAQFMFFNGLSRTAKGEIAYLENPYLQDNLAFSFQMQVACNEYYPGIARRIYLKAYRYNMHVCPKTLLIELGAQNNTREEIWNACEPLAHVLDLVLSGVEPER
ncbi:MAG: stage II sporulation protein P [Lachnospiraceae bacterium]|nr:stage II sporulation protein P [Lachnospiraceae bacterium]